MTHITCRLTAKNRDQLRNPTLGHRVWATYTFLILPGVRTSLFNSLIYHAYLPREKNIRNSYRVAKFCDKPSQSKIPAVPFGSGSHLIHNSLVQFVQIHTPIPARRSVHPFVHGSWLCATSRHAVHATTMTIGRILCCAVKDSPYSITEHRVLELIPVLCSQPAGDVSHKPGGRLPLLSATPAVTPATLKSAAASFAAW